MHYFQIQFLEEENGKWFLAGRHVAYSIQEACDVAKVYIKEECAAVIFRDDTLLAYGGPKINEKTAMRHGTGTVNRLTKKDNPVQLS